MTDLSAIEMFFEERVAGHADVEAADAHVNTKEKEMPVILMSNTIVEPRWSTLRQGLLS